MSRVEENEKILQNTTRSFHAKPDEALCLIEGQKLGILMDISKSLAIIADSCIDKDFKELYPKIREVDDGK